MDENFISTPILKALISADAVSELIIKPNHGGYNMIASVKDGKKILSSQRSEIRLFKKSDSAIKYSKKIGWKGTIVVEQ